LVVLVVFGGVALATVSNGTSGPNRIVGTSGGDRTSGGADSDTIWDGPFVTEVPTSSLAGPGNDRINANNGPDRTDFINCGAAFDSKCVDRSDRIKGCERVKIRQANADSLLPSMVGRSSFPYWAFRARRIFAGPQGTAYERVGLLISSSENLPFRRSSCIRAKTEGPRALEAPAPQL
jgi:hypothetical protein